MLASIQLLLNGLEKNKITYCHWKSNEHLAEALNGDTDLDILFDTAQRLKIEKVFSECGVKRFRATPLMQYNAIEDFIGFDQESAKIWHVHTHYRMTLGEKHLKGYTITSWSRILLQHRVYDSKGIWTIHPAYELILLLCRIALKLRWRDIGRDLGNDDIVEINWLFNRTAKHELERAAAEMLGKESLSNHVILKLLEEKLEKKSQFRKLQKTLRDDLSPFTSYSDITSWIARSRRELFWLYGGVKRRLGWDNFNASRRISPIGGTVVAILGCDGAGKTTTLHYIKKEFNKKIDVVSIYLGSGDGSSSLLRRPMKIVARKVSGKGLRSTVEKEYQEKNHVSLKSRLYSLAKIIWAVTLAHEKKAKLKQLVQARNNGLLVLTDRYPQCVMPGIGDGPLLHKYLECNGIMKRIALWEQEIYENFSLNAPDLTIKLMVPTEVAIARKPEMTAEEIENKKRIVMNINVSEHVAIIDTSKPFEITRGEVMKEIWDIV